MRYRVLISRGAEKEMRALEGSMHARLARKILSLEDEPRPRGSQRLSERDEYRIRVGDYRILYTVDDDEREVKVVAVGHRRDVYR